MRVVEDRIIVSHLELTDAGLAGFVGGVPEPERVGLAANALRVGLQALSTAGTSANLDLVRAEFARMVEQMAATQTRAAEALDASPARRPSPTVTASCLARWRTSSATPASSSA